MRIPIGGRGTILIRGVYAFYYDEASAFAQFILKHKNTPFYSNVRSCTYEEFKKNYSPHPHYLGVGFTRDYNRKK